MRHIEVVSKIRVSLSLLAVCSCCILPAHGMRDGVPIVIGGESVLWESAFPQEVVAFSYHGEWRQIPVQIDERDVRELSQIYGEGSQGNARTIGYGKAIFEEVYCDAATFTGPDQDPTLDGNDEIIFMAQDAGSRADTNDRPEGTRPGSGMEIELSDPLNGKTAYVYLYLQDGSLDPSAGISYVHYDFRLLSGDYKSTYNTAGIDETTMARNEDHGEQLNPEDSFIRTAMYERHWSYRWTCDSLCLASGPNLVEREDYWIAPGSCGRHIGTFNAQEGAFIANISGPVRAIRSFLGANSGPLVQVDRVYYQAREDVAIYVRVHPRSSVGMFYVDHTVKAIGMTYANDLNLEGVLIDGQADRLALGPIHWELITGVQGSMIRIHDIQTNIDFASEDFTLFYADEVDTRIDLCSACLEGCRQSTPVGDSHLIGASGVWNTAPLPNTDPSLLATHYLTTLATMYYGNAVWATADAVMRHAWVDAPIHVELILWPESAGTSL